MDKALYTAMTGAAATLRQQATVSHNLANVSTAGFKAALTQTQAVEVTGPGYATRVAASLGSEGFDASAGASIQTGNQTDVLLAQNHWLVVQAKDGSEAYTRAGDLKLTSNGQLMTSTGDPVMGDNGPITLPPHSKLSIGADGTLSIVPQGQGPETVAQVGRIRTVRTEPSQLERGDDGLMRAVAGAQLQPGAGAVMTTGAIEGSNVNPAEMLVEMIELARQFEMQVKVISTGDENARAANSLLRLS